MKEMKCKDCNYYHDGRCDFRYSHPKCDEKDPEQECDLEDYLYFPEFSEGAWV